MNVREQKELYRLLEKLLRSYTSGAAKSESIETAQQLLFSIEYCMNSYYKGLDNGEPYGLMHNKKPSSDRKEHISDIYEKGVVAVKGCVQKSKELWIKVQKTMADVDNEIYQKTIMNEISDFFEKYDPRFGAQLMPVAVRYPLALKIEGLSGIEYIYEYLYRLLLENEFVIKFDGTLVNCLINGYHKETRADDVNLFELVLQNVLGLSILNRDISSLHISEEDCKELLSKLEGMSIARLQILCEEQVSLILSKLGITNQDMITYTREKVKEISQRLLKGINKKNLTLLFLSFHEQEDEDKIYFEGNKLSKEKLSEVIDELNQMRYLKDKLQKVRKEIHCLNDLKVVISECFAGEEYEQVFHLLLPSEYELLVGQVKADLALGKDESLIKEWELVLIESEKDHCLQIGEEDESRNGL